MANIRKSRNLPFDFKHILNILFFSPFKKNTFCNQFHRDNVALSESSKTEMAVTSSGKSNEVHKTEADICGKGKLYCSYWHW